MTAAVAATALLATACTTPGSERAEVDTSKPVETDISGLPDTTLSVWTSESGNRMDILKRLAKSFEAEHPNVKIKWTVRDFATYPTQIKLALSSSPSLRTSRALSSSTRKLSHCPAIGSRPCHSAACSAASSTIHASAGTPA